MKYICFGYLDIQAWAQKSSSEQEAALDACLAYDEELRRNGNWVGGEGLQGPDAAVTLRRHGGSVAVTDGPFVETKEMLGGILSLKARDLTQAIQLLSKHPGTHMGPWEIRPVADLTPMIKASEARRGKGGSEG